MNGKTVGVVVGALVLLVAIFSFQNCSGGFQSLDAAKLSSLSSNSAPEVGKSCEHPDDPTQRLPVGAIYDFSKIQSGTTSQCEAAHGQSVCQANGSVFPAPIAGRFKKCTPFKLGQSRRGGCLLKDEQLLCWGAGEYTAIEGSLPLVAGKNARVTVAGGVTDFATRWDNVMCAIVNGATRCWGTGGGLNGVNEFNQVIIPTDSVLLASTAASACVKMKNDSVTCLSTIPSLTSSATYKNWGVDQLAVSGSAVCGLEDGAVKCIEDGVPVVQKIASGASLLSVTRASGVDYKCALVKDKLMCFGVSIPLPDGTVMSSEEPVEIANEIAHFSTGEGSSSAPDSDLGSPMCVVTKAGAAECWGAYQFQKFSPKQTLVTSGASQVQVDAFMRIAVLMENGTVKTNLFSTTAPGFPFVLLDVRF